MKKYKNVPAWTIGNFYKGAYKSRSGEVYDETSTTVEIINVDTQTLIALATAVCNEFRQKEVILKNNNTGNYVIIDKY